MIQEFLESIVLSYAKNENGISLEKLNDKLLNFFRRKCQEALDDLIERKEVLLRGDRLLRIEKEELRD